MSSKNFVRWLTIPALCLLTLALACGPEDQPATEDVTAVRLAPQESGPTPVEVATTRPDAQESEITPEAAATAQPDAQESEITSEAAATAQPDTLESGPTPGAAATAQPDAQESEPTPTSTPDLVCVQGSPVLSRKFAFPDPSLPPRLSIPNCTLSTNMQ